MAAAAKARRIVARVSAPLLFCCWASAGWAAELDISPVGVALSPAKIRDTVTLTNNGELPTIIEARVFRWTQVATDDRLDETTEAIAVPPIFTLPPLTSQVVRVGLRRKPEDNSERAYRLILSEVPDGKSGAGTIAVALQLSLPVFYTPPDLKAEMQWSVSHVTGSEIRVALKNVGGMHVKISEVMVTSPSAPEMPLAASTGFQYVLPGATRTWTFFLGGISPGTPLLLQARNRKETLGYHFEMPQQ